MAEVFANLAWFHELCLRSGVTSAAALQRAIEPTNELAKEVAAKRRWRSHRAGRHTPLRPTIELAEQLCPGTQAILQSPLWRILEVDRPIKKNYVLLKGTTSIQGDVLLERMFGQPKIKIHSDRWLHNRCSAVVALGTLEGLAVLTACMRLAGESGAERLALVFYHYVRRCMKLLGAWFQDRGIALCLAEYYELVLFPLTCPSFTAGGFGFQGYLIFIDRLREATDKAGLDTWGKLGINETNTWVIRLLKI